MIYEEDQRESETGKEVDNSDTDYLAAITELKKNSVDRSEYEKLKAENKKLLSAVINGGLAPSEESNEKVYSKEDINKMRIDLYDPDKDYSNLEYIQRTLELRKALISNGEVDPFIPTGKQISPTKEDYERAEFTAQVYQECVDYANGDSVAFTNELMRRTKDVRLPKSK